MNVKLLAFTQLTMEMINELLDMRFEHNATHGQLVALTAIRTCYSHNTPSSIIELEGEKYFGEKATDGAEGTEADRLIRHIMNSGHTSTLEHLNFTFSIEGVSRSLLAQLTRHRHFSYSVQSQRYVSFGSENKAQGFDYVVPPTIDATTENSIEFAEIMDELQDAYDRLRKLKVKAEDARYLLPNAATCNLVFTGNLRSLLDFYSKRGEGTHAQWEIKELAEKLKEAVVKVEPWTKNFFKTN